MARSMAARSASPVFSSGNLKNAVQRALAQLQQTDQASVPCRLLSYKRVLVEFLHFRLSVSPDGLPPLLLTGLTKLLKYAQLS